LCGPSLAQIRGAQADRGFEREQLTRFPSHEPFISRYMPIVKAQENRPVSRFSLLIGTQSRRRTSVHAHQ
jgi:hypothetical protein